jgi:CMP-2-keto-3-deoxyoctulosonic acid synthetase
MERNLEQMRAVENNLILKVGLSDSKPLSVDTEKDLKKIIKEMN